MISSFWNNIISSFSYYLTLYWVCHTILLSAGIIVWLSYLICLGQFRIFTLLVLTHALHVWDPCLTPCIKLLHLLNSTMPSLVSFSQHCLSQPVHSIHPSLFQSLWNCITMLVISLKHLSGPFNDGLNEGVVLIVFLCRSSIQHCHVLHGLLSYSSQMEESSNPVCRVVHLKDHLVSSSILPDNKDLIKVICFGLDLKKHI